MAFMPDFKENTNLGKRLYKRFSLHFFTFILAIVVLVLVAGSTIYMYCNDIGYCSFHNDLHENITAKVTFNKLYKIASNTENSITFCMYFVSLQDGSDVCGGVVLMQKSLIESDYSDMIVNSPDDTVSGNRSATVTGFARVYPSNWNDFMNSNESMSHYYDIFGSVYLDTTVTTYPTVCIPALGIVILVAFTFVCLLISDSVRDARVLKALANLNESDDNAHEKLDVELASLGNLSVDKFITLTANYYVDVKKICFFPLSSIAWCYINVSGRNRTLVAHTVTGRKYILISAKNRYADILLDELVKRLPKLIVGNDRLSKQQYRQLIDSIGI